MISTFLISPIRVIVPIPSPARRAAVPVITTGGIITPIVIIVVAVIRLIVGVSQKDQGPPCRHNDLGDSYGNKKARKQESRYSHSTILSRSSTHSTSFCLIFTPRLHTPSSRTRTGWDLAPELPPLAQSYFASGEMKLTPTAFSGRGGIWPPNSRPWPNHTSPPAR